MLYWLMFIVLLGFNLLILLKIELNGTQFLDQELTFLVSYTSRTMNSLNLVSDICIICMYFWDLYNSIYYFDSYGLFIASNDTNIQIAVGNHKKTAGSGSYAVLNLLSLREFRAIAVRAVLVAMQISLDRFGPSQQWHWGEVHTIRHAHPQQV